MGVGSRVPGARRYVGRFARIGLGCPARIGFDATYAFSIRLSQVDSGGAGRQVVDCMEKSPGRSL